MMKRTLFFKAMSQEKKIVEERNLKNKTKRISKYLHSNINITYVYNDHIFYCKKCFFNKSHDPTRTIIPKKSIRNVVLLFKNCSTLSSILELFQLFWP